jgi:hypothetical protein
MYDACGVIDTGWTGACGACSVIDLHVQCIRCHWHRIHSACSVIDTACTMHVVSLTPNAQCMQCHWLMQFFQWQWHHKHRACGVIDTACIIWFFYHFHHFAYYFHFSKFFKILLCIRCQWHRMHCAKHAVSLTLYAFLKFRISSQIWIYIRKGPRTNVIMKKRGSKISWYCPFKKQELFMAAHYNRQNTLKFYSSLQ